MRPIASSEAASRRMRMTRSRDTKPELALRRLLHRRGLRFRVHYGVLPRRTADVVFPRQRIAVFVDGCFWHSCPDHGTSSSANAQFWAHKLASNHARDLDTDARLKLQNWTVLRFWEHDDPERAARAIEQAVRGAREAMRSA